MRHAAIRILLLGFLLQIGCGGNSTVPLEMTTLDPGDDHEKIAQYYRHEATLARQQVEELTNQAAVYEQIFGRDSDWVSGTRLLVQFYEDVAREQDQLAERHLTLNQDRSLKERK